MVLIEDTRQQASKHEIKHEYWQNKGIKVVRSKLVVGDYTRVGSTVFIDTKANVEEIAQNIGGREHARFREECKLARDIGARLIILVENEHGYLTIDDVGAWVNTNPRKTYKSIDGKRLAKAMKTMSERYGVQFLFCAPEDSGQIILDILGGARDG